MLTAVADQAGSSLEARLQAQLDARPIWTEAAVAQHLPEDTQFDLDSEMTRCCYQFREGVSVSQGMHWDQSCEGERLQENCGSTAVCLSRLHASR